MKTRSIIKTSMSALATVILVSAGVVGVQASAAHADVPNPPATAEFQAAQCAGTTEYDPTVNLGSIVPDTTLMFGERLTSYNDGRVVPLYDALGSTVLIASDGTVQPHDWAAYPPICSMRYVASAGEAVSEWMFCTDRSAQSCGDTNELGEIVDHDGIPINPMDHLAGNPRLTHDQEKLIAYLVQHGHAYDGVGNQGWGGVTTAQANNTTNERMALQTLVWCVSDPAPDTSTDFGITCANSMSPTEQARLLTLIPDAPELVLSLTSAAGILTIGQSAEFSLTTNAFNQPIELTLGGTATPTWSVCGGDATLTGTTLQVDGTDPSVTKSVTLCATATASGEAQISASATPASLTHIGWSQSQNNQISVECQVYATFDSVNQMKLTSTATTAFTQPTKPLVVDTAARS